MCTSNHEHDHDALEWWPVELSDAEADAVSDFYDQLEAESPALDEAAAAKADALVVDAMQRRLGEIMDGAMLSHYCHLLNGWGDAVVGGHRLTEGLVSYCRAERVGEPYLVQFDRDGDFHPFQTLAYAAMAGIGFDHEIPGLGCTLRQLYDRSRTIQTDDGAEMGHMLFALAHLGVEPDTRFELAGRSMDVSGIMDLAIDGHHHGHFRVCRKVHLTEGICAAAAMIPQLKRHRAQAQAFLDGQLDLMLLLALVLDRLDGSTVERDVAPGGLVKELRDTLAVADRFEDHVFLAGHYIELAAFAGGMGYEISPLHRNAMVRIANAINRAMPAWLPRSPFAEQFLFYGHYRRALTLLPGLLAAYPQAWMPSAQQRAEFCIDFDGRKLGPTETVEPASLHAFTSAEATTMRPEFAAVLEAYAAQAPAELAPRGFRHHFRHIKPATWPQALHYELLDYGDTEPIFTLEIHIESEAVRPLRTTIATLVEPVRELLGGVYVDWQPQWSRGRGRLRVAVPHETPPADVAKAMLLLIEHTRDPIEDALMALRDENAEPGLYQAQVFAVA
ncbi:MAG: hypothetical protein AAF799_02470 [Myxococcota bacterium]